MTATTATVAENTNSCSAEPVTTDLTEAISGARARAESVCAEGRLSFARGFVFAVVNSYWRGWQSYASDPWSVCEFPSDVETGRVPEADKELAETIGQTATSLDPVDAGYKIGVLYTGMLPRQYRTALGAYYTPPALCERLLDMATRAGVDWRSARVLDPACGGCAFLSPVARRMAASLKDDDAKSALTSISRRLNGFELDPFAAWLSTVFLEATLDDLCRKARARLKCVVRVCDSLDESVEDDGFDLVVGNPPYGRLKLSPDLREKYRRSLFGHANLYGVFTDLALRFAKAGGVIAYVTPTSFLAGEYFKALRGLLGREAPPSSIDFIEERKGVFADVLQETLLAVYRRGGDPGAARVSFVSPGAKGSIKTTAAGSFCLPKNPDEPWLMPRTKAQSRLLRDIDGSPYRLADYGYTVSTGPLVWNRHKPSLRAGPGKGRYPLIWAESIRSDGVFEFRAEKRNHKPFFKPKTKERWVLTECPCVLLQRTTAKEQCRRLIAAELPASFIDEHGAVAVENHLNMIKPANGAPKVSPAAVAVLLNSNALDQVFRCINDSVAVSAYELAALPLPWLCESANTV